jgi:hypothetical protein
MQLTLFAPLHGTKYRFFILENRAIFILEAIELMSFTEMFFYCSFNHMQHQMNCVGAKGALVPAVCCEKPNSIFFHASLELSFSSSIIVPIPEFER